MVPDPANPSSPPAVSNQLAGLSFVLSLVFPLGAAINVSSVLIAMKSHNFIFMITLGPVAGLFGCLGLPAMIGAIITGHMGLSSAKQYPLKRHRAASRWPG
jgi:hypothetical protein